MDRRSFIIVRVILGCLMLVFLTACGGANKSADLMSGGGMNNSTIPQISKAESEIAADDGYYVGEAGSPPMTGSSANTKADIAEEKEQKIIKTAYMYMSVKEYDGAVDIVKAAVLDAGGYVESASSYVYRQDANKSYKSGSITIRVPSELYESVKSRVAAIGKVTSENENAENVTQQYYDISARLSAKTAEENRLRQMIEKAEKIEDLILLEERLSNVRADIETYQSRLDNIDRMSSFSTIRVEITEEPDEVIEPVSEDFGERIYKAFIGSINGIVKFFENAVIFIAGAFVPILMVAALALAAVIIIKIQNKDKRKGGKEDEDDNETND